MLNEMVLRHVQSINQVHLFLFLFFLFFTQVVIDVVGPLLNYSYLPWKFARAPRAWWHSLENQLAYMKYQIFISVSHYLYIGFYLFLYWFLNNWLIKISGSHTGLSQNGGLVQNIKTVISQQLWGNHARDTQRLSCWRRHQHLQGPPLADLEVWFSAEQFIWSSFVWFFGVSLRTLRGISF